MLYYLGKGTEFKKEDCKEYKKLDAALKAAAKDESLVVWDETGKVIGSLTDDVPEGALQTNPDGSIPAFNEDGTSAGTVDSETVAAVTGDNEQETQQENAEDDENASNEDKATNPPTEQENGENGANTEADEATEDEQEDKVIIPQGKMRVTAVCLPFERIQHIGVNRLSISLQFPVGRHRNRIPCCVIEILFIKCFHRFR